MEAVRDGSGHEPRLTTRSAAEPESDGQRTESGTPAYPVRPAFSCPLSMDRSYLYMRTCTCGGSLQEGSGRGYSGGPSSVLA